ncbi:hypothetical protein, partial [Methylobacterium sp. B1]|uniref:hypothetical protein n=1 Tax=Methylobacterium sp. B1 TaxID=91459 RepID=UPI001AEC25BC
IAHPTRFENFLRAWLTRRLWTRKIQNFLIRLNVSPADLSGRFPDLWLCSSAPEHEPTGDEKAPRGGAGGAE